MLILCMKINLIQQNKRHVDKNGDQVAENVTREILNKIDIQLSKSGLNISEKEFLESNYHVLKNFLKVLNERKNHKQS